MATRRSTRKKVAPRPPTGRLTPKSLGARQDGKDTAEKVLTHAIRELDKHGAVNFSLDRVIASSKVSRSSIYHLFGNRAGVIAQAEARAITLDVSDGAHLLRNLVDRVEMRCHRIECASDQDASPTSPHPMRTESYEPSLKVTCTK
jgi:AcrR family transcriptional regulator